MVLKTWVGDREISSVDLTNGAGVRGYWKDTFGYAYIASGVNGSSRLRPASASESTRSDTPLPCS